MPSRGSPFLLLLSVFSVMLDTVNQYEGSIYAVDIQQACIRAPQLHQPVQTIHPRIVARKNQARLGLKSRGELHLGVEIESLPQRLKVKVIGDEGGEKAVVEHELQTRRFGVDVVRQRLSFSGLCID